MGIPNLGMFGVSSFVSILPPNQGTIMAVAASTPTAVLQKNGMIGMVKQMTVTLTCDHRHIYGADAAKFLVDLADLIENDTMKLLMWAWERARHRPLTPLPSALE